MNDDQFWMKECLHHARRGIGRVSPNPAVGAVLVRNGKLLARGFHRKFGGPHAEVECLRHHFSDARGATLYVNLEPCCHFGKTPPCTDAILKAGISRVVVGMPDPNPVVSGKGIGILRRNGIEVDVGICEPECRDLNRRFIRSMESDSAYVHLKLALSIDGKLGGAKRWISSMSSRRLVHRWRATHDAILVGSGTIIKDNPRLDVRHVPGRNPHVVIVDGRLRISPAARVFVGPGKRRVIVCTSREAVQNHPARVRRIVARGAAIKAFPSDGGRISLREICKTLWQENIGSILVEGGQDIAAGFAAAGLVDELSLFIAPVVLGGNMSAFQLPAGIMPVHDARKVSNVKSAAVGPDLQITYLYT